MRPGDIIDYTLLHEGSTSNNRPIGKCPHCGRNGEVYQYDDGTQLVVHKAAYYTHHISPKDLCHIYKNDNKN